MKNGTQGKKKLSLNKETLRKLDVEGLRQVAGGQAISGLMACNPPSNAYVCHATQHNCQM